MQGLFRRLLPAVKPTTKALSVESGGWPADLLITPTLSGPSVTPASALRVPAVAAAVNLVSTAIGSLPVKVFAALTEGGKEADAEHPAFTLVHDAANEWTSAGRLREMLTADAMLTGNGFAYANRVAGRVVEFIRLDPGTVSIQFNTATGEPCYRVTDKAGARLFAFQDVLHVAAPGPSPDGVSGVSPVVTAREAIGLALTMESHAARLFGRGARPSGILRFPDKLAPEMATRIKAAWQSAHGGSESGGTAVLEQGAEFQALSLTSVDAQFAELRAYQISEIARAFNVPAVMIGDLSRATWKNLEQLNAQFVAYTLSPWLRAWEAAYGRILLTEDDRAAGVSVEFVTDALLRGDTAARAESYSKMRSAGILTANEIRSLENLPPHPEGDTLISPHVATQHQPDANPQPQDSTQ